MKYTDQNNGHFIVTLGESFDFENHKDFRDAIRDIISKTPKTLDINFSKVEYIDSSALGMLMLAKHECGPCGCNLRLVGLKDGHAKNVIQLVKFDQIFTIES